MYQRRARAVQINRYTEFERAPSGELLDLKLDLPNQDFEWTANAESAVVIDEDTKSGEWRFAFR